MKLLIDLNKIKLFYLTDSNSQSSLDTFFLTLSSLTVKKVQTKKFFLKSSFFFAFHYKTERQKMKLHSLLHSIRRKKNVVDPRDHCGTQTFLWERSDHGLGVKQEFSFFWFEPVFFS